MPDSGESIKEKTHQNIYMKMMKKFSSNQLFKGLCMQYKT